MSTNSNFSSLCSEDVSTSSSTENLINTVDEKSITKTDLLPQKVSRKRNRDKVVPTCNICIEPLNKSTRIEIKCEYCEYNACKECYKRYLLDSKLNAHCMNCKKEWDSTTMVKKFDRIFLDTAYKRHKENILIEREKGLMVATQPLVENQILKEKMLIEIDQLRSTKNKILARIRSLEISLSKSTVERKLFIQKCTKDDCRGFLSSQWKCGLCECWTCPDCHELIGRDRNEHHLCDTDTLATVKLLDSDTKSCPKCSVGIFKIEGCDQMFCTECHTAFSWKTGKIEHGQIHNPHYFQYQNDGGFIPRNPMEIRCGREIDHHFVQSLASLYDFYYHLDQRIIDSARNLIHINNVEIPRFQTTNVAENQDLRIQYMRNRISEDTFKKLIGLRERKMGKNHEFYNILIMFVTCQTELFYRLYHECEEELALSQHVNAKKEKKDSSKKREISAKCADNLDGIVEEIRNLLKYTNIHLASVSHVYKCKIIQLSPTFEIR